MDGDIGTLMQSVLSDPEQMAKITQLAQGLMGQSNADQSDHVEERTETPSREPERGGLTDGKLLSALTKAMAAGKQGGRSSALLTAMRPYLRPEKQGKLDRAFELARMVHIAGAIMGEMGGRRDGI